MQMKKTELPCWISCEFSKLTESLQVQNYLSDVINVFYFNTVCVDECFRLSDGVEVKMVGGVNEIVDTLGVNEGLEGEG